VFGESGWDEGIACCEGVFVEGMTAPEMGVIEPGVYIGLLFCPGHFAYFLRGR
jgi:hypothetical protein